MFDKLFQSPWQMKVYSSCKNTDAKYIWLCYKLIVLYPQFQAKDDYHTERCITAVLVAMI